MYAVAGVSGQTGAAVAEALVANHHRVRVIVRRADAGAAWRKRGAEVAVADLADSAALTAALRGVDGAYLLNPPRYDLADPFAAATLVGASIARALEASAIPRAVVLSSVGAHQAEGTGIIGTARRVEQALQTIDSPLAILRANYFFENWRNVLPAIRDGVLPSFLQPLDRRLPMVPVADIAQAVVRLLTGAAWTGRRVIDLASFDVAPADVAAAFGAAVGRPVQPVAVPHAQWAAILGGAGFRPEIAQAFVAMYDGINAGIVAAEPGSERERGATTLGQAVQTLMAAPHALAHA